VGAEDVAVFEEHFKGAFICAALDGVGTDGGGGESETRGSGLGGGHACWPLFNVTRGPRFVAVPDGFHTLDAVVTHPNSGEEIGESWSVTRAFLTLATEADQTLAARALGGGSSTSESGGGGVEGGGGGAGFGNGYELDDDGLPSVPRRVNHVVVEVDMSGPPGAAVVTHLLPVQRSADFSLVAHRFCSARGVGNGDCVTAMVGRIRERFAEADERTERLAAVASAAREAAIAASKRRVRTPEGPGILEVPLLLPADSPEGLALDEALFAAVSTCAEEHRVGGVGLDCLTAQSSLFGMRERPVLKGNAAAQEALLDFIGNLGAGYGF